MTAYSKARSNGPPYVVQKSFWPPQFKAAGRAPVRGGRWKVRQIYTKGGVAYRAWSSSGGGNIFPTQYQASGFAHEAAQLATRENRGLTPSEKRELREKWLQITKS